MVHLMTERFRKTLPQIRDCAWALLDAENLDDVFWNTKLEDIEDEKRSMIFMAQYCRQYLLHYDRPTKPEEKS